MGCCRARRLSAGQSCGDAGSGRQSPALRVSACWGIGCCEISLQHLRHVPAHTSALLAALGADSFTMLRYKTRSEEHTSELQSLMRNSYAVFCLKKKHITHKQ